jgi:medium-chain acyl-[acyl-carrier-protein] hydrolase
VKYYFEKTYQIRTYEVDLRGHIRITSFLNYMQDLAYLHATRLGFGIESLLKQNMTWVLSRNHIKFFDSPGLSRKIIGRTWPAGTMGRFALREFEFFDESNNIIATATTSWILLDIVKKKPVEVQKYLNKVKISRKRAIDDSFNKLPQMSFVDNEVMLRVRVSDLDVNKHVNNVVFVEWALESISLEDIWHYQPIQIEVVYRREVYYGEEILSRIQKIKAEKALSFLHQLVSRKHNQEIAFLRSIWKKV